MTAGVFICEQDSPEAEALILLAARAALPAHAGYLTAEYAHCQWSVICDRCGCRWDAYDSQDEGGFGFVLVGRREPYGRNRCRV